MNQANIDSLTARIKVGSLVQLLYQETPIIGLVVAISKGNTAPLKDGRKKRAMTFVTMSTSSGLKKYPIFWCEPVE